MINKRQLGTPALKRLPLYLRQLIIMREEGECFASGAVVAKLLDLDPIVVRKDLAQTGVRGRPRVGFPISELIERIEQLFGVDSDMTAVLVGVGKLGSALLCYPDFRKQGLTIVAAFDAAPERCDIMVDGIPVFPVHRLTESVLSIKAKIGILTVPAEQAQRVADQMVVGGIKAIWNFTPTQISVPEGVIIKREDLAISLAVLIHRLSEFEG